HVAAQHRAHARLIAFAGALEPADDVGIETQRDLLLALRQAHRRLVPEPGRNHAGVWIGRGTALGLLVAHLNQLAIERLYRNFVETLIMHDPAALSRRLHAHVLMPSKPK